MSGWIPFAVIPRFTGGAPQDVRRVAIFEQNVDGEIRWYEYELDSLEEFKG